MSACDNRHCVTAAWLATASGHWYVLLTVLHFLDIAVEGQACLHFWMGHLELILMPEVDVFEQFPGAAWRFSLDFHGKWLSNQSSTCMG